MAKRGLMNTLLVLLVIRHPLSLFIAKLHPSSILNLFVVHLLHERLDCRFFSVNDLPHCVADNRSAYSRQSHGGITFLVATDYRATEFIFIRSLMCALFHR